jgi:hypothetical protein
MNGGSSAESNAILWVVIPGAWQTSGAVGVYAFQAKPTNGQLQEFSWSDTTNGPGSVKFSEPTDVNGYIYVAGARSGQATCTAMTNCYGSVVSWH